jgi:hypothetical protein
MREWLLALYLMALHIRQEQLKDYSFELCGYQFWGELDAQGYVVIKRIFPASAGNLEKREEILRITRWPTQKAQ